MKFYSETKPMMMLIAFFLRYLHLWHNLLMFLAMERLSIIYDFLSTSLQSVSTPECSATLPFQWMSLMIAYAIGECLSTIETQNVASDKSCMVFVMEPVIDIELVGRIRPVYNNLPSFSLLNLVYWPSLTKYLTSSDDFLK